MKLLLAALFASAALSAFTLAAHADTLYTEYLIDTTGVQDGYLQFAISAPPPATGAYACTYDFPVNCKLETLNVYLGSSGVPTYMIQQESSYSAVTFNNGQLTGIFFTELSGYQGFGPNTTFTLNALKYNAIYFNAFVPPFSQFLFQGTISATPAAAATPEPSSLALLSTGLLGAAGLSWRRLHAIVRPCPERDKIRPG